ATWIMVASDHGFYAPDAGVSEDPAELAGPATAWHRPYGIVAAIEGGGLLPSSPPAAPPPPQAGRRAHGAARAAGGARLCRRERQLARPSQPRRDPLPQGRLRRRG